VSMGWFAQQMDTSLGLTGQSGGNCGASGCSQGTIELIDYDSGLHQIFRVLVDNPTMWEQVQ